MKKTVVGMNVFEIGGRDPIVLSLGWRPEVVHLHRLRLTHERGNRDAMVTALFRTPKVILSRNHQGVSETAFREIISIFDRRGARLTLGDTDGRMWFALTLRHRSFPSATIALLRGLQEDFEIEDAKWLDSFKAYREWREERNVAVGDSKKPVPYGTWLLRKAGLVPHQVSS